MKLHILSDLHNDFTEFQPPQTNADVVILAGDICEGSRGIDWAELAFSSHQKILYVCGNHEHYDRDIRITLATLRERAKEAGNIHILENDEVVIGGVRFLGCTLWTDFRLFGDHPDRVGRAMHEARNCMTDFQHCIRVDGTDLTPARSSVIHADSVRWLEARLATPFAGATVVVTHHAPHPNSVAAEYSDDLVTAAFVSDLTRLMGKAALWVHGHTHHAFDYVVNGTRVVCNPRGYTRRHDESEEEGFQPGLVVTVGEQAMDTPTGRHVVLYLDIDGVLHRVSDGDFVERDGALHIEGERLLQFLPQLTAALEPFPQVAIVVSSSWRWMYTLEELKGLLGPLGKRVIGTTPPPHGSRFEEIQAHLMRSGYSGPWLAIDDTDQGWPENGPVREHLIQCHPDRGLGDPEKVSELVELLHVYAKTTRVEGTDDDT